MVQHVQNWRRSLTIWGFPLSCVLAAAAAILLATSLQDDRDAQSQADVDQNVVINSIGMKLVLIPAGEFLMGAPDSDSHALWSERPQHRVRITKPFHMGVYEVTQREYKAVMRKNPSWLGGPNHPIDGGPNHPVEDTTWNDANEFCLKLSKLRAEQRAGRRYRLPTEAEWEYACRARTTTRYNVGDMLTSEQANIAKKVGKTTRFGSYPPNAFGLYDMHGNVWEWCADWYDGRYYKHSPSVEDPKGPPDGSDSGTRVVRGGGYDSDAVSCSFRSAILTPYAGAAFPKVFRMFYIGFRVAMDAGRDMPTE